MGEVKNAFIKSKMNKDLDDRLIPSGEYRHTVNAQVSKSEGSDVGALENVLGNKEVANLTNGVANVSSIGYFADEFSGNVYIFLTDNTSSSYIPTGTGSNHFIFSYNINNNVVTKLVEGAFLNFSKLNPIFGVNLLEKLLFWTDNRNQPRKINVQNPLGYYTIEEHISVAKYYPYRAIDLYSESALVADEYESTMKDVVSKNLPNGGSATCSSVISSSTFSINDFSLSIQIYPNAPQQGFTIGYVNSNSEIIDLEETVVSYNVATLEVTLTGDVTIPLVGTATELVFNINPYYESDYSGDDTFLEDKFVRFSYRFRFDDGEYSLIAPFTQVCFIPRQDGYFLNTTELKGDEKETFESTIVKFMENKVNKIYLQVPLPCPGEDLLTYFHITDIDIIYKESNGLALQVVETIPVEDITIAENVFEYVYSAKKPYKTLPSSEITRVYDKIPVKALAQEIISNRVVYGNYLNKQDPPSFLNYNVAATQKSEFNLLNNFTSSIEYPSSSLKMNRNYQVGFVLADKFGRQSTVILSNNKDGIKIEGVNYSGSTFYQPYFNEVIGSVVDTWRGSSIKVLLRDPITDNIYNNNINSESYNPLGWYSYKVVVKQTEQEYYNVYTAGALKGDPFAPTQDLSFTYLSLLNDNINKVPRDLSEVGPMQDQFRSSIRLFGRVEITERSATNIGNEQFYPGKTFFTSTAIQNLFELFGVDRANPPVGGFAELYIMQNAGSNPITTQLTTSQNIDKQFGIVYDGMVSGGPMSNLSVFETNPETSRLDIFWETSTSGVISEINTAVTDGVNIASGFSSVFNVSGFNESISIDEDISSFDFTLVDSGGFDVPTANIDSFVLTSVFNTQTTPQNVSSYFTLYETGVSGFYNIKVNSDFIENVYFGSSLGVRVWDFKFTAVINDITSIVNKRITLNNVAPVMDPTTNFSINILSSDVTLTTLTALNGANTESPNKGRDLNWTIVSQIGAAGGSGEYFYLSVTDTSDLSTCRLRNNLVDTLPADNYEVVLRVQDAGGAFDEITITVSNSVEVLSVKEYNLTVDFESYLFTIVEANYPTDLDKQGFYVWLDTWSDLVINNGGFTILLDYTSSAKIGCPTFPNKWIFKHSENTAINQAIECVYGFTFELPTVTNIDFSGYGFEIV